LPLFGPFILSFSESICVASRRLRLVICGSNSCFSWF